MVFHSYQRSDDKGVIFYTDIDRLVLYTICAVQARKRDVSVLAASFMFTHIHLLLLMYMEDDMSGLLQDSSSAYARAYNHYKGSHGQLFHKNFGRARKRTAKEIRTSLAYVNNNHVEKGLCSRAIENRWSFLAYAVSNNPFSKPLIKSKASRRLLRAIRQVDRRYECNKPLTFSSLVNMFDDLDKVEREQLIDHIIVRYALVDFEKAIKYFGSFEKMVLAFDSNTGSEYDIAEAFVKAPDTAYVEMIEVATREGWLDEIFRMGLDEKHICLTELLEKTSATMYQAKAFLHI